MTKRKKTIELRVTISCPPWVSRRQAKKEVRALINEQCFYGHVGKRDGWSVEEIGEHNFRARKVE